MQWKPRETKEVQGNLRQNRERILRKQPERTGC